MGHHIELSRTTARYNSTKISRHFNYVQNQVELVPPLTVLLENVSTGLDHAIPMKNDEMHMALLLHLCLIDRGPPPTPLACEIDCHLTHHLLLSKGLFHLVDHQFVSTSTWSIHIYSTTENSRSQISKLEGVVTVCCNWNNFRTHAFLLRKAMDVSWVR